MPERLVPSSVQQIGQELAILWNDGTESYLGLEDLRRACPCAMCGGEPDVMGNVVRPDVSYAPSSFDLHSVQQIGGYALQPTWGDGHGTGLYSFKYLKHLSETQRPSGGGQTSSV
ncbi:MAG: DUF971 domain-containing protein [Chthoniobacteraceae bacterium]